MERRFIAVIKVYKWQLIFLSCSNIKSKYKLSKCTLAYCCSRRGIKQSGKIITTLIDGHWLFSYDSIVFYSFKLNFHISFRFIWHEFNVIKSVIPATPAYYPGTGTDRYFLVFPFHLHIMQAVMLEFSVKYFGPPAVQFPPENGSSSQTQEQRCRIPSTESYWLQLYQTKTTASLQKPGPLCSLQAPQGRLCTSLQPWMRWMIHLRSFDAAKQWLPQLNFESWVLEASIPRSEYS